MLRLNSENTRLAGELTREKTRFEELVSRYREAAVTLRDSETDRAAKTQQLAQSDLGLRSCVDRNANLYALNQEVLGKFEDQGFWSSLARREPFTQLKRVQLENLVDDYRNRALDQKAAPAATPAP